MTTAMDTFWRYFTRADIAFILYPPLTYWAFSLSIHVFLYFFENQVEKYRVQPPTHLAPNKVSKRRVIIQVVVQQVIQALVSMIPLFFDTGLESLKDKGQTSLIVHAARILFGAIVFDTWQYWIHRAMHQNRWLYSKIHSVHHRLLMPYAFGALYNHPLEAFLLDTMAGMVTMTVAGLTMWEGTLLFSFAMIKTIDDHCGYTFPWDPIPKIFSNNCAYHDIHHQIKGIKYNFAQPFFSYWDQICGTKWDDKVKGSVYSKSTYDNSQVAATGEPQWKSE